MRVPDAGAAATRPNAAYISRTDDWCEAAPVLETEQMTFIVTDNGFREDDMAAEAAGAVSLDALVASDNDESVALALGNDADIEAVRPFLDRLHLIVIPFPSFADGRGFTLARRLRQAGYAGRLRASGHLIADQYGQARRVGFDEVAISDDLAARQPEAQWLARAAWQDHSYQKRLQTGA